MANVQQPEMRRSGRDPLVQDSAKDRAQNVGVGGEAGRGPVPPDQVSPYGPQASGDAGTSDDADASDDEDGSGNGMSYEDELAARAEVLRNGGPTSGPGIQTTTGPVPGGTGRAHSTVNRGPGVAPTTTGDATSGGMDTPLSGATSDATSGADEFLGNPDR